MFSATPFLIPGVADRLGVALGLSGLMSTFQVGAFAVASLLAGRLVPPGRASVVSAGLAVIGANAASALAPTFVWLLATRLVAGGAAGILTWVAWSDAMQSPEAMRSVASVGPLTTLVTSFVFGWMVGALGDQAVFFALAVLAVPLLVLPVRLGGAGTVSAVRSPSRSNRVLLGSLLVLTMAGSGVFVYAAAAVTELVGFTLAAAAVGYSLNAVGSIVATRLTARPGTGGYWLLLTGVAAGALLIFAHPGVYYVSMVVWGFAFWMGVPETFRALAARSITPAERIGDAQSGMAVGRAIGPFLGGLLVGTGSYATLGLAAGLSMISAAGTIAGVERYRAKRRRSLTPSHPTGPP